MMESRNEWLQHEQTIRLRRVIEGYMVGLQREWAAGVHTADTSEGTAQKNAVALGQYRTYEDVLELLKEDEDGTGIDE